MQCLKDARPHGTPHGAASCLSLYTIRAMEEEGKAAGDKGPPSPRSEGKSENESESSAISPHYDASKDVVTR